MSCEILLLSAKSLIVKRYFGLDVETNLDIKRSTCSSIAELRYTFRKLSCHSNDEASIVSFTDKYCSPIARELLYIMIASAQFDCALHLYLLAHPNEVATYIHYGVSSPLYSRSFFITSSV